MENVATGCSTGILVDIEDKLDEEMSLLSLNKEKQEKNISQNERSNLLGTDLSVKRDLLSTPKRVWKTPSPKSMKMINKEASRIIYQLHSSPIETIEAQLIDEDFPTPFSLDDCTSDSSPESESSYAKGKHGNEDSMLKVAESSEIQNEDESKIEPLTGNVQESPIKIEDQSPILNENESLCLKEVKHVDNQVEVSEDNTVSPNNISSTLKKESVKKNELKTPLIKTDKENISIKKDVSRLRFTNNQTSLVKKNLIDPNLFMKISKPKVTEHSGVESEDESSVICKIEPVTSNVKESPTQYENESTIKIEDQSPIIENESLFHKEVKCVDNQVEVSEDNSVSSNDMSSTLKSESVKKNELKTPLIKTNKENKSIKKNVSKLRFTNNQTINNKKNLIDPNLFMKISSALNAKTPIKDSVRKDKLKVIPEKTYSSKKISSQTPGTNRRNSVLPQLARTMPSLPAPSQISALNKTLKATPVPKFVRRTQSFQTNSGNPEIQKTQNPEPAATTARKFQSGIGSIKKDSNPIVKSRLSICQLPKTGNPSNTPVSRSQSFPKRSGTLSSGISRPSLSAARKVNPIPESSQIHDPERTVLSTSSRIRFNSRLLLPSPLPDCMNATLPRKLFADVKTTKKI